MEKDKKSIYYKIDFNDFEFSENNSKKIIKKLSQLRKKADFLNKSLKIDIINKDIVDLHQINDKYEFYVCTAIMAVQINDKKERCNFLYDEICFLLDHVCSSNNLCEFKDNKCFVKKNSDVTMGCCHHYPNKKLGIFYQNKMVPCEYLGDRGCTTKAIGCKLYMCPQVNKKGYKFTVYNVLLIRYFFNFMQKLVIISGIFDTKENIMKRLLMFN